MALWDFLKPWCNALRPIASARATELNPHTCVRRIEGIDLRLPVTKPFSVVQLRQAVELLGRALRIDTSLWSVIPQAPQTSQHANQQKYVDPRAYRDEDLVPAFTFVWDESSDISVFRGWLKAVRAVVSTSDESNDAPESDKFQKARRMLLQADVFTVAGPGTYSVRVSLRVKLWDLLSCNALVAFVKSTSASLSSVFQLTHIDLDGCLLDASVATSLLVELKSLGIVVRSVSVEAMTFPGSAGIQSLRIRSRSAGSTSNSLVTALVQGPEQVHAEMSPSETPDWLLLVRAASYRASLRRLSVRFPNLSRASLADLDTAIRVASSEPPIAQVRVRIHTPEGSQLWKTLCERAAASNQTSTFPAVLGGASVLLMSRGGEVIITPRSSVEIVPCHLTDPTTVSLVDPQQANSSVCVELSAGLWSSEGTATLLLLLKTCFASRLTSLSVNIVSGAVFTSETIATILAAFPSLLCLKLFHTQITTMDVFLDAYRTEQCRIQVLSIDSGGVGFIAFFEELGARGSMAAKTLLELKMGYPRGEAQNEDAYLYLRAVEAMLEHNTRLQLLGLAVANASSSSINTVASKLRRFHRVPVAVAAGLPIPLRVKLAFITAVTAVCPLDSVLVATALAFAAPCLLRIVQLHSRTSRGVKVSKIPGGTRYSESMVHSEFVDLAAPLDS